MVLSVSRRTDIPAFYSEWFFNRMKEGFVYVRNPFNKNTVSKISLTPWVIDCIVFWTKNPSSNFFDNLKLISDYNYYFLFTVNPYNQSIEQHVPKKQLVIDNFIRLSQEIGKEKVIWRYDPILISDKYSVEYHMKYFEQIAKRIYPYTEKCKISFVEFYKKCSENLKRNGIRIPEDSEVTELVTQLKQIADSYDILVETCAGIYDLGQLGINRGKCIDNELIERITGKRLKAQKDKNQREKCYCIESIDIGEYNTCKHNCVYCYANLNKEKVLENSKKHISGSPLLIGDIKSTDTITERETYSLFGKT